MNYLAILFRGQRRIIRYFTEFVNEWRWRWMMFVNQVEYGNNLHSNGLPFICVSPFGKARIGDDFSMNNGTRFNPIGYPQPCIIYVDKNAHLKIGNRVGISQTAIICHYNIEIGNDTKIGGGVKIYDTDFHSLNPNDRLIHEVDMKNKKKARVTIGKNVLIGAGSIILKGVTIGDNTVIGAGSVVTKPIPSNQIWGGNPAKFIREI